MPSKTHTNKKTRTQYFAHLRDTEVDLILRYGASIADDVWFLGRAAAAQEIERRQREIAALHSLRRTGRVFRVATGAS